jgi:hypothetical protein
MLRQCTRTEVADGSSHFGFGIQQNNLNFTDEFIRYGAPSADPIGQASRGSRARSTSNYAMFPHIAHASVDGVTLGWRLEVN